MAITKYKSKNKGTRYKALVEAKPGQWFKSRTWDRLIDAKKEEAKLIELRGQNKGADHFSPRPFTRVSQMWYQDCANRKCSAAHLASVEQNLRNHLLPFFGDKDVKVIRPSDVTAFVGSLSQKGLANATVNSILTDLKALFNFLLEDDSIHSNPVKKRHKLPPHEINNKPVWSSEQAKLFLDYADKKYQVEKRWVYIAYLIASTSGLRFGEIMALEKSDFDFDNHRIRVSKAFCSTSKQLKTPKNGKTRHAPLAQRVADEVKQYCVENHIFGGLFVKAGCGYIPYNTFREIYLHDMKGAKVPITKFHNLRRFFIRHALENGIPEAEIRKACGHGSIQMTDLYYVQKEDLCALAKVINL